jgi:hypothetical protein
MLAGVEPRVMKTLKRTGLVDVLVENSVFPAQPGRQAALEAAIDEARRWISQQCLSGPMSGFISAFDNIDP